MRPRSERRLALRAAMVIPAFAIVLTVGLCILPNGSVDDFVPSPTSVARRPIACGTLAGVAFSRSSANLPYQCTQRLVGRFVMIILIGLMASLASICLMASALYARSSRGSD
jgi:hypothetical protein